MMQYVHDWILTLVFVFILELEWEDRKTSQTIVKQLSPAITLFVFASFLKSVVYLLGLFLSL